MVEKKQKEEASKKSQNFFAQGQSFFVIAEIFELGIYPCPDVLNRNTLLELVQKLSKVTDIDYRITLQQWYEMASKELKIGQREAQTYYATYKLIFKDKEVDTIDVKMFSLYLGCQLFSQSQSRYASEFSSIAKEDRTFANQPASPRKAGAFSMVSKSFSAEPKNLYAHFVKNHIRLLLRLISSDVIATISASEVFLQAKDLNVFSCLLKNEQGKLVQNLSQFCPFFDKSSPTTKIPLQNISEWLNDAIQNEAMYEDKGLNLSQVTRAVTVEQEIQDGVIIENCEEGHFYIDSCITQAHITMCKSSQIFIAAIKGICLIEKCENCTIVVAGNLVKVGNCVDCIIYTYTSRYPALFGDCRGIQMAPHNAFYPQILSHLKKAGMQTSQISNIHNWAEPVDMNFSPEQAMNYTLLQPKDYFPLIMPSKFFGAQINPSNLLTPEEYIEALSIRSSYLMQVQTKIAQAQLNEEQKKILHMAIQGHFREWLVNAGHVRGLTELLKLIDQEYFQESK